MCIQSISQMDIGSHNFDELEKHGYSTFLTMWLKTKFKKKKKDGNYIICLKGGREGHTVNWW